MQEEKSLHTIDTSPEGLIRDIIKKIKNSGFYKLYDEKEKIGEKISPTIWLSINSSLLYYEYFPTFQTVTMNKKYIISFDEFISLIEKYDPGFLLPLKVVGIDFGIL